jgi:hypothetical protein
MYDEPELASDKVQRRNGLLRVPVELVHNLCRRQNTLYGADAFSSAVGRCLKISLDLICHGDWLMSTN